MRKKGGRLLIGLLLSFLAGGCTQNNGHIGKIFGNWKFEKAEYNGVDDWDIAYPMYWAFQNTTFRSLYLNSEPEGESAYGNFRLADNTLFLEFPDTIYLSSLPLPIPRQTEWNVLRLTSSEMTLQYNPEINQSVTLQFKKW